MTETTMKVKHDLPLRVAGPILAALEAEIAEAPGSFLVEPRLHRAPDGSLALATVTHWVRVQAISERESELAWARRQGSPVAYPGTLNGRQPVELAVYPERSPRARLAAKRALERTGS